MTGESWYPSNRLNVHVNVVACVSKSNAEPSIILFPGRQMSRVMRNQLFACAKTKTQISCAVTAQLISAFDFATQTVQPLYFLNQNFQASCHLLLLRSSDCVGPVRKPRRQVFSRRSSNEPWYEKTWPRGYKTVFMLISAEHEISTAHKYQISQT